MSCFREDKVCSNPTKAVQKQSLLWNTYLKEQIHVRQLEMQNNVLNNEASKQNSAHGLSEKAGTG